MKKFVTDFEDLEKRRVQLGRFFKPSLNIKRFTCFFNKTFSTLTQFTVMDEKLFDIPLADYTEFLLCKTEFEGMHHVSCFNFEVAL